MTTTHVAVVGAGPAGFFTAAALLKAEGHEVHVDVYERLPTPWGLVRSGVAPDHPKIKSVSAVFARTAQHTRFRYFGNVEVGRDVERPDLLERYDAVVWATGARHDRQLSVPGEELPGAIPATHLVGWYNGHPDHTTLPVDLTGRTAVVVGNGNVALDVARLLSVQPDALRRTDIADHALDSLTASRVEEVVVVGRRGPLQATFTASELRELGELDGVHVAVDPADLDVITDEQLDAAGRAARTNVELLRDLASRRRSLEHGRLIALRFARAPAALHGRDRVESIDLACNDLREDSEGRTVAVDSGRRERLDCGLVVSAIGYRGDALGGLPFDPDAGVVPHVDGRVVGADREYVVGWFKRGPSGIIGTNKKCAQDTVDTMLADLESGRLVVDAVRTIPPRPALDGDAEVVGAAQWLAIDSAEVAAGEEQGRPRVKLCTVPELLAAART